MLLGISLFAELIAKADAKHLAAMDGKNIVYGGGASKIELPRGDSGPPPPESAPIKPVSP